MAQENEREVASRPEDLGRLFFERVRSGNLDGLVALFEPEAVSAQPDGGRVTGHDAIRRMFEELLDEGPSFTPVEDRPALRTGDLALTSRRLTNGEVPVEVARRQPDGTWLWVLDQPNILG